MTQSLGTILTAMVTPFTAEMALDERRLQELADELLSHGSDGLVVAGTTGESPTLTDDEKERMFRLVCEVAKDRGTVVAGTGSNDTRHSIELTRRAEVAGVDGVLVVSPYYNKPPTEGLRRHFEAVAASTSLPMIIYNIPSRCVVDVPPALLAELAQVENIVAVKQANPDLAASKRLTELSDMGIYAGNDDMLLDILEMGGWGGICVASHLVGERMAQVAQELRQGRSQAAHDLDAKLAPLYKALFATTNPILVKAALDLQGRGVGGLRLPLIEATPQQREALKAELLRQALL